MNSLLPILLSWFQLYGYPALWGTIFIASVGAPLPIGLILLAMGAFSALGDFNIVLLALTAISASVAGDSVGYLLGRWIGYRLLNWLMQRKHARFLSPQLVARSRDYFQRRGGLAVFLSRFLVPALGGTVNIVAGAELYPYRRFFLYDVAGETLGALISLILGYTFGASWEALGDILFWVSLLILAALAALYLSVNLVRLLLRLWAKKALSTDQLREKRGTFLEMAPKRFEILPPWGWSKRIK